MLLSLCVIIVFVVAFFSSVTPTFAAINLTFSDPPSELNVENSFTININMEGASAENEYYIQGRFIHESETRYLGLTKNQNGDWKSYDSEYTSFFKIKGNGTWPIEFKPDVNDPDYKGPGTYTFSIVRFTQGGSPSDSQTSPTTMQLTSSTSSPTPTATTQSNPEPQIELSEIMACPANGESEWVELKNTSSFTAELTDWFIKDSTESYQKKFTVKIPSGGYSVIDVTSMNNTGDTVRLFNQASSQVASMSYVECSSETSWIHNGGNWIQTTSITKNASNQLTAPPPDTPTPTPKPTATPKSTASPKPSDSPSPSKTTSTSSPNSLVASPESATLAALPLIGESGEILGETVEGDIAFPDSYASDSAQNEGTGTGNKAGIIAIIFGATAFLGVGGYFLKGWYNKQIHT